MVTSTFNVSRAIESALAHHQAGRFAEAKALYEKVLAAAPKHADALHLLGVVAHQTGDNKTAVKLINEAITATPGVAVFYNNCGEAYRAMGSLAEAIACYEKTLELDPGFVDAHNNLGIAFQAQGKIAEAIKCYERALALQPNYAKAHNNLGFAFQKLGRLQDAGSCYERALTLAPDYVQAHHNLGCVLQDQGRLDEAAASYQRALMLNPEYIDARNNLGNVAREMGRPEQAAECYEQVLKINPASAEAHNNLAGVLLNSLGRPLDAVAHFREAISLQPDYVGAHSNLLLALNYGFEGTPEAIYAEHLNFFRQHVTSLAQTVQPHRNDRASDRPLKIGYLSGDFRSHAVAHFIEPVLKRHDKRRCEVFCYYNHSTIDAVTRRLQSYTDHWRSVAGVPDEDVARQIREDGIDILVDLSGHTSNNRMLLLVRKPAPVQVSWLGYPNTTGLPMVDYRITDSFADPVGETEHLHTEHLMRLPETFSCYGAPEGCPDVGELPLLRTKYPSFGSLNSPAKITSEVIRVWSEILDKVPGSKLMLKLSGQTNAALRRRLYDNFARFDIASERLALCDAAGPQNEHLQRYHEIDIALDPFPYN
ncbi:MAG: O-linked N-acetylglucosamine transferase, SPINDLY family protein, partial [Gammaproteobacteria bacterium]